MGLFNEQGQALFTVSSRLAQNDKLIISPSSNPNSKHLIIPRLVAQQEGASVTITLQAKGLDASVLPDGKLTLEAYIELTIDKGTGKEIQLYIPSKKWRLVTMEMKA